jgi:hypothetical protein
LSFDVLPVVNVRAFDSLLPPPPRTTTRTTTRTITSIIGLYDNTLALHIQKTLEQSLLTNTPVKINLEQQLVLQRQYGLRLGW